MKKHPELSDHYGTFRRNGNVFDIRFERLLHHPVKKVWDAITTPEYLAIWCSPVEIDLRIGGTVKIRLLMATLEGIIIQLKEPTLLEYRITEQHTIRWELFEEGKNNCRLVFTETAVSPADLSGATPGWHYYIDIMEWALDGKEVPAWSDAAWEDMSKQAVKKYTTMIENLDEA